MGNLTRYCKTIFDLSIIAALHAALQHTRGPLKW